MKYFKALRLAIRLFADMNGWEGKSTPFSAAWKVAIIIYLGK